MRNSLTANMKANISVDTVMALLLALLMYLVASTFSRIGIDIHHDGIVLKPAIDVLSGQMLFRDSFTQYGAFFTYFQAAAMLIFGAELLVIRLQTALMYAVTTFFLYKTWRYFLPTGVTIVSTMLFIFMSHFFIMPFLPWSSVYGKALVAIAVFLLFKFIESTNLKYILSAGVVGALAFYTRQPVGIVLFIATLFLLVNYGLFTKDENLGIRKLLLHYSIGFFSVFLVFSVFFLITGSFYDWWAQSLRFAFYFGFSGTIGATENLLLDLFLGYHWTLRGSTIPVIWAIMPILCIFLFVYFYVGKLHIGRARIKIKEYASKKEMMLLFYAVIAIASWHQYYPVPCLSHVYWAAGMMIGVFVYCVWEVLGGIDTRRKSIILIMVVFVFFYGDIHWKLRNATTHLRNRDNLVTINFGHHLNGMMVDAGMHNFLHEYFAFIDNLREQFPEKQFINDTRDALFAITFGENLLNMTVNWGNAVYPDYHANVRDLINRYQPIIVTLNPSVDAPGYVLIGNIHNIRILADASTAEEFLASR